MHDTDTSLNLLILSGMEVTNRKREREENEDFKIGKKQEFFFEENEILKFSDSFPSLGVFEFPWEKDENALTESDEWKSNDVFYSSLVDGSYELEGGYGMCEIPSASMEFPDDSLEESWPLKNEEMDGADCIWSCALSQPLSFETGKVKVSNDTGKM